MNIEGLISEIRNDPLSRGYSEMTRDQKWESLNTVNRSKVNTSDTRVNELGLVNAFANPADGEVALQKLEAIGQANSLVGRMLDWLKPGAPGIDIANVKVRAMLDSFVAASGITETEANTIKSLGETSLSRLDEIGNSDMQRKDFDYILDINNL